MSNALRIIKRATVVAGALACVTAGVATSAEAAPTTVRTNTAPAPTATTAQVARYGAGWLADQIVAGGGHLTAFGSPDPGDTAYAVIGLHAVGVGSQASAQAIAYLRTQLGAPLKYSDGTDNPGRLGYWILAAVSAGKNPAAFGGTAPENNLVARLLATQQRSGLFGTADATYDGAFRQGVALTALKAAGVRNPRGVVAKAVRWLTDQQCADGLWVGYRADVSVPCPAADPSTFAGPDTNNSAMAVQGLAAYRVFPRQSTTLDSLHAIQSADGGFPYLAAAGQDSDPDSTALVVQALIADGVDPATWTKGSNTPQSALASYQLGCADPAADRGAFFYPGDRTPNILATVQAVPAAAGLPLSAVRARRVSAVVPHQTCGAATPAVTQAAPVAAQAGTAGHCPGSTGVTVFVDLTAFGKGTKTRCAPGTPATGVAALQQAGFTVTGTAQYGLAFICRINGYPTAASQSCQQTPPANAYWAYYHANAGATAWTYSTTGASTYKPAQGSIEGWAFGNSAKPSKTPAQVRVS